MHPPPEQAAGYGRGVLPIIVTTRVVDEMADGPDGWAPLAVTLTAALAHASQSPVIVVWEGPVPPTESPLIAASDRCTFVERPPFLSRSQAFRWIVDALMHGPDGGDEPTGDLLWLADDVVIGPDTVATLLADVATIRASQSGLPLGFVSCRADHAPLPQQVGVTAADQIVEINRGELNLAFVPEAIAEILVPVWHDDLGDEVLGLDLSLAGFRHFVSRAVVQRPAGHRITSWGPGGQVPPDAAAMLTYIRPDIVDALTGVPDGLARPTPADEAADPAGALRAWRSQPLRHDGVPLHDVAFGTARCLRALGRPAEAAAALGDLDVPMLTIGEARFVADLARLLGDHETALDVYAERPDLAAEHAELTALLAQAP
jgi:hypothetical protein